MGIASTTSHRTSHTAAMAADKPTETPAAAEQKPEETKTAKPAALGEDDEFEDFPVEDWPENETEAATQGESSKHLWEESWDDDDTSDDFSQQLKAELQKVEAGKRK